MAMLLQSLIYSTDDERRNRPNPTQIPIDGKLRSNLASYRDAANRYRNFSEGGESAAAALMPQEMQSEIAVVAEEEIGRRISLERDMQSALREQITKLGSGLTIIDDGAERSVESGFIDITARDTEGSVVVIELKAGAAGQRAIAQILSYMGDVASDFDHKAKAAARMVPNLTLRKYSINFMFCEVND